MATWWEAVKPRSAPTTDSPASLSERPSACADSMQRPAYSRPGVQQLRSGDADRAEPAGVVVGRQPGVHGGEDALGDLGVVGRDDTAWRAAEGLVGREGDDVDPVAQGVLEAPAGDQPGDV